MHSKAQIGVVMIHGMGDPPRDFAKPLIEGLRTLLGAESHTVAFESCYWSPILQKSQDDIWKRLTDKPTAMTWSTLRRWVVSTLGDPVGYLSGYEQGGTPVLQKVHECLAESIAALEPRIEDPATTPLVIMAHSLGSVIVTNYLWNIQRAAGEVGTTAPSTMHPAMQLAARHVSGVTAFQQMATLTSLITFGSNIPLFLPPAPHYECVRFPRPVLPAALRDRAQWLNIYDPADVLGYPLNNLWDETHGTTIVDTPLNVGPPFVEWTPLSHLYYWESTDFHTLVAQELRKLLRSS